MLPHYRLHLLDDGLMRLIIENARLVGILRGWTDGAYDGYVCDLAVDPSHQKQGIGEELLARVAAHYGPHVQWILRASKIATGYYQHLG